MAGELQSGDRGLVLLDAERALVAAVDGLGHGREAARAAASVVDTLTAFADEPLDSLTERCHEELRDRRGAVLSLARFCASDDTVTWLGVGNVEGRLLRSAGSGRISVESLIPARGIAGDRMAELEDATLPVRRGDVVVLATDGIEPAFADTLQPEGTAEELAARVLAEFSKPKDDALVVVARYLGRAR